MRVIAAVPALAILAGSAAGLIFSAPPFAAGYFLLSIGLALSLIAYRFQVLFLFTTAMTIGFFGGAVLLSSGAWQRAWQPPLRIAFEGLAARQRAARLSEGVRLPEDDSAFAIVEGTLRSDAADGEAGVSLNVLVDGIGEPDRWRESSRDASGEAGVRRAEGGILASIVGSLGGDRVEEWRRGRRVRFPVQLRRPSRYLDPGVPDQERALARRGTTLVGTVKSAALVEVIGLGSRTDEALGEIRAFARRAIANAVGPWTAMGHQPSAAAIVSAIVIGDRAGLDKDIQRRLLEAGTYHVIAISGGNIAILAGLLVGGFRIAGWLGRTAMLAAIVLLALYARLVGGGASVDRATLMAVVYLASRAFDQRTAPLNVLALAGGLLACVDPLSIVDPAFVLTFGATLAIVMVAPLVRGVGRAGPLGAMATLFAASLATELTLFPIAALSFSRVTFAGLGLNFIAIPLMAVAQIAGMAVVPLALLSARLAAVAGLAAYGGACGLIWSAQLVRYLPLVTYRIAPPAMWVVAVYYGAASAAWVIWRWRVRMGSGAEWPGESGGSGRSDGSGRWLALRRNATMALRTCVAIAVASALWVLVDPHRVVAARGDGRLHVTVLDVGQGDSSFIRFPHGRTLLVDAGGLGFSSSFDIGERVVAPVIRDSGFYRLDLMALTHGDPDHIGGAASIVDEFRPREVWEGIPVPRFEPLTALRMRARSMGSRWTNVYAGDRVDIDGVSVVAWHPAPAEWERQRVRNDDSLVLELRWQDVSILLTGDIGAAVESGLRERIPAARLRVVKVAHHGSLTSSSRGFVDAMRPRVAIVSTGRANHFGHPAPEVLERYQGSGAEIFRTDRDGAVMVATDGRSMEVRTFSGRHTSYR
jgi:competence protein ComEC